MMFPKWDEPLLHTRPTPSAEQLQAWQLTPAANLTWKDILAGDFPADLKAHAKAMVEWNADWELAAKDRPWETKWDRDAFRLFGGRWIDAMAFRSSLLSCDVLEARFGETRIVTPVWSRYVELAQAGHIEACRKIALAIYESLGMVERAKQVLAGTVHSYRDLKGAP